MDQGWQIELIQLAPRARIRVHLGLYTDKHRKMHNGRNGRVFGIKHDRQGHNFKKGLYPVLGKLGW